MSEETKQPSTDTDGKKVSAAPKSAAKKPAARKTTAKKPVAKKPVTPKPAVKRAAPKKTAATVAKKPTSTAAKKPSATKSAAAKRSTAARKAAPVKTGAANPAAKPAEPVSASAEKASPSAAKVGPEASAASPEASAASDTYEHARADAKAEQHSSRTDHSDDPYSAENLAADFKEKDWKEVFVRAAFTVFYVFAGWIAIALGFTFTVIQFLIHLVTGHPNDVVKNAILCIGQYIGDIAAYVSFDSDERPFPFGKDLPDGK